MKRDFAYFAGLSMFALLAGQLIGGLAKLVEYPLGVELVFSLLAGVVCGLAYAKGFGVLWGARP